MGDMDSTRDQFYKVMLGDFLELLRLPPHFMSNFRQQLSDSILLKCPSGRTWPVRLASSGNDWFFIAGWAKFAQHHELKENDLLLFHYDGRSSFKVEIYCKTGCEEGIAHYAKAHASSSSESYSQMERDHPCDNPSLGDSVGQSSTRSKKLKSGRSQSSEKPTTKEKQLRHGKVEHARDNPSLGESVGQRSTRLKKCKSRRRTQSSEKPTTKGKELPHSKRDHASDKHGLGASVGQRITRSMKLKRGRTQSSEKPTTKETELPHSNKKKNLQTWDESKVVEISDDSTSSGEEYTIEMNNHGKGKCNSEEAQTNANGRFRGSSSGNICYKSHRVYLISNRREVSEKEKHRALRSASRHCSTLPFLMRVMKQTQVQTGFVLILPKQWGDVHLPNTNNLEVKLRVRGPASEYLWPVLLKTSPWRLGAGWYNFMVENNLEVDDVCIFELSQGGKGKNEPVILDVFIHRVVEDVVPKTRLPNY
ncbi:hypothetical protein Tsubulata_017356 [Turnera subulata]|uniref:TF-B3 domain-containing protein n=1 Tax=Turnera subulata TaxID=218843 RepID=A0A9Q0GCI0_9ROSI|nr:hypothetical protein Tsubulata_017356 [Turnera subulata]